MGLKLTDFFKGTDSDNQVSEDYYNISNEDALKTSGKAGHRVLGLIVLSQPIIFIVSSLSSTFIQSPKYSSMVIPVCQ